jgi:hypothetical protein
MGYWPQGEQDGQELVWGDVPADILGEALHRVIWAFMHDMGRVPSAAEIQAGIEFTLPVLTERLPKTPEGAVALSPEQQKVLEADYYLATGGDVAPVTSAPRRIQAAARIEAVLEAVCPNPPMTPGADGATEEEFVEQPPGRPDLRVVLDVKPDEPTVTSTAVAYAFSQREGKPKVFRVSLAKGESAWNPASTKNLVYGPADLVYRQYADGGVELSVREVSE